MLLVFCMALLGIRRRRCWLQAFLVGCNHCFDEFGVEAGCQMLVGIDARWQRTEIGPSEVAVHAKQFACDARG